MMYCMQLLPEVFSAKDRSTGNGLTATRIFGIMTRPLFRDYCTVLCCSHVRACLGTHNCSICEP